jgi:hypothetical protein
MLLFSEQTGGIKVNGQLRRHLKCSTNVLSKYGRNLRNRKEYTSSPGTIWGVGFRAALHLEAGPVIGEIFGHNRLRS